MSADSIFRDSSRVAQRHQLKQSVVKGMFGRLSFAVIVLVICTVSLFSTVKNNTRSFSPSEVRIISRYEFYYNLLVSEIDKL